MKKETKLGIYAGITTLLVSGMLIHYQRFGSVPVYGYGILAFIGIGVTVAAIRKKTI